MAWLNDELERRPYGTNTQYGYNNWSPPAQSNETSNGYYLERSHSARLTLARAHELCPSEEAQEELEEHDMSEDTDSPPPEAISENSNITVTETPRCRHSETCPDVCSDSQTNNSRDVWDSQRTEQMAESYDEMMGRKNNVMAGKKEARSPMWSGNDTKTAMTENWWKGKEFDGDKTVVDKFREFRDRKGNVINQGCPASPTHTADPDVANKIYPWINNPHNESALTTNKIKPMTSPAKTSQTTSTSETIDSQTETDSSQRTDRADQKNEELQKLNEFYANYGKNSPKKSDKDEGPRI